MRMQVRFENGSRAEAVLLASGTRQMRVVLKGSADTEHWEMIQGGCVDETGQPVEIEAVFAVEGTNWAALCAELGTRTMAMG